MAVLLMAVLLMAVLLMVTHEENKQTVYFLAVFVATGVYQIGDE
jgi:hypothetical protein